MKRNVEIEIKLNPLDIAKEFLKMSSHEQASVFNMMAYIVEHEWKMPFCFQLQSITDEKHLSDGGRAIMEQIGEYSSSVMEESS